MCGWIGRSSATFGLVLALHCGLAYAQDAGPPTMAEVMSRLGYTEQDRAALLSGDVVATDLTRTRDDQLIAAVGVLLPTPVETLAGRLRSGDAMRSDAGLEAIGALTANPAETDWCALRFEESDREEAASLLRYRGGGTFNLSDDEIRALRETLDGISANAPDMLDAVSTAYRSVLRDRHDAYQRSGLDGVSDYAGGLQPAAALASVLDQSNDFLTTYAPKFWQALSGFPADQADGITNNFYWLKRIVEGRPEFVLMHEMIGGGDDLLVLSRREFFVGHTYQSLQVIAVALPTEEGSAVFYVNSAFTDQITGFFSGIASSVGQERVKADLTAFFAAARD